MQRPEEGSSRQRIKTAKMGVKLNVYFYSKKSIIAGERKKIRRRLAQSRER